MIPTLARCLSFLIVAVAAGCNGPPLYPVEGRVTVDGRPLTTGDIVLYPDDGKGLPSDKVPQGTIDAQGTYKLTTGGKPGVPAGRYKVAVVAQTRERPKGVAVNPLGVYPLIANKFLGPETTPLRIEVGPDPKPGAYDLAVTK